MAVEVKEPTGIERYVTPEGTLTPEGQILFNQWVLAIKDLETRVTVLEP